MKDESNLFETYTDDMKTEDNPISSFNDKNIKSQKTILRKMIDIIMVILCILGGLFIVALIYGALDDIMYKSNRLKNDGYYYLTEEEFVIENGTLLIPQEIKGEIIRDVFVAGGYSDEKSFTKISIPVSIDNIDFSYGIAKNIEEFIVDEESPYFSVYEGSLYDKQQSQLICYASKSDGKRFPDTLKVLSYIAKEQFFGIHDLTDFEIEYSLDKESDKLQKYIKIKVEG